MTAAPVLAPRERPILFSAPMVLAILDGRKTVTRRLKSDYRVGDLLYVRETWASVECKRDAPGAFWGPDRGFFVEDNDCEDQWQRIVYAADCKIAEYGLIRLPDGSLYDGKWRPSIHMPKWASRITLEVTAVRKERLQDITEEGAKAEGARCSPLGLFDPIPVWHFEDVPTPHIYDSPIAAFEGLWDQLHGPGAWASNPEVHVIEFRRVK